ncbi:MAG: choline-phosphate cytidylyltransferase, partial [Parasporobacterium sp.]|nr:choline-phosphate cytidylyltransferase [Parasporobacterium sp.]
NPDYLVRNNHSSIYAARNVLGNSYVCSSDNYFSENPFEPEVNDSYYAAIYADGPTEEWCITEDPEGYISGVTIGGENAWYMLGHTFFSEAFSKRILDIIEDEYDKPETYPRLWESIYLNHLDELKMKVRKYGSGMIFEFDTLDELRLFDESYQEDTRSEILKRIASELQIRESEIRRIETVKDGSSESVGFTFRCPSGHYRYLYDQNILIKDES